MIGVNNKALTLRDAIGGIARGEYLRNFQTVEFATLSLLPAKPFAYWAPPQIARLCRLPHKLEPSLLEARAGLRTLDNFRFLRLWWEIPATRDSSIQWVFHLKGGAFQKFFSNPYLLCAWAGSGKEVKSLAEAKYGSVTRIIQAQDYYFRPGLTFTYRTSSRFSVRSAPAGCNFGNKGPLIVTHSDSQDDLYFLLGYLNSPLVGYLISLSLAAAEGAARSYEVGIIQRLPLITFNRDDRNTIINDSKTIVQNIQSAFQSDSTTPGFVWKPLKESLSSTFRTIENSLASMRDTLKEKVSSLDKLISHAAGVEHLSYVYSEYRDFEVPVQSNIGEEDDEAESVDGFLPRVAYYDFTVQQIETSVGATFGVWDIRYATGKHVEPSLPNPFASLPTCPPGMLQDADTSLPARETPPGYPLRISWPGILVDDLGHPEDIESRVREVLEILWPDRADAIEQEAVGLLGVKSLRDYFRRPAGFFADHLKRYSKSRRQAPIYWPLSTTSGSYTLWIYYQRLTDQTLHTAIADFLDPKLKAVERDIASRRESASLPAPGNAAAIKLGELVELRDEIAALRAELERVIALPWRPNLNDGVLITASPLWRLFRLGKWQKDLKACWDSLAAGEYDWAHLAYTIWPDRVREKCRTDRSLAIAHNLEELCTVESPKPKAKRIKKQPSTS